MYFNKNSENDLLFNSFITLRPDTNSSETAFFTLQNANTFFLVPTIILAKYQYFELCIENQISRKNHRYSNIVKIFDSPTNFEFLNLWPCSYTFSVPRWSRGDITESSGTAEIKTSNSTWNNWNKNQQCRKKGQSCMSLHIVFLN